MSRTDGLVLLGLVGVLPAFRGGGAVGYCLGSSQSSLTPHGPDGRTPSTWPPTRSSVKSSAEFLTAVAENPFVLAEKDHSRLLVAFAQSEAATQALSALLPMLQPPERLHIASQAAYVHCAGGILESKAGSALLGKLGREVTTRNWATVLKLKALLGSDVS